MSEESEVVSIKIPKSLNERINAVKIHARQPAYEVIAEAIDLLERKKRK
jgi:hypothetical protein